MSFQSNRITDFVPSYQVKSNFLPTKVVQVNESDKNQIVAVSLSVDS
jgi:hypothetical protein